MSINIDFSFTEKFICIQSRISAGLSFTNFDIQPIYLDIDVNNAILGQKIKEALSKSIDILDGEERSKVEADETGKAIVQSMNEANQAVQQVAQSAGETATQGFKQMAEEAKNTSEEVSEKSKTRQGATSSGVSRKWVYDQLKSMGYDDSRAKSLAASIFVKGMARDQSVMQGNMSGGMGNILNHGFKKLHEQGFTSSHGAAEIAKALQKLQANAHNIQAPETVNVPSVDTPTTEKTVKLQFNMGGQVAEMTGTQQNVNSLEQMMRQLETIKKRM